MRRVIVAAATVLMMALSSSTAALGAGDPVPVSARMWVTTAGTAAITSCTSGNSGTIDSAEPYDGGTAIRGTMSFCRDDGSLRHFGIEFFTATGASGYFFPYAGASTGYMFLTNSAFAGVTGMCVAPAPNDRVACASIQVDATGAVNLTPAAVTAPFVKPSGPMRGCGTFEGWPVEDPTCATCV